MPPLPLSSRQDDFYYEPDSTYDSGVVQIYGFKSKKATGGDGVVVDMNAQEREIWTMNDLNPYVQTLSLADLESCVALENAAFPEEERCSREKVREPVLCIYFSIVKTPTFSFFSRRKKFLVFSSFKST